MKHNIPPKVAEALKECGMTRKDALWDCHGTLVINHKSLEKIAVYKGVVFEAPQVIEAFAKDKIAVVLVTGTLGDSVEWSFGESAPYNTTNKYPYAMAEKRAKDRVILKLVGLHGDLYSEEEADDFKNSKPNEDISEKPTKKKRNQYNETPTQERNRHINNAFIKLDEAKESGDMELATEIWEWAEEHDYKQVQDRHIKLFGK